MRLAVCSLLAAAAAFGSGLPARNSPADYPARTEKGGVTVAARVLDDEEVKSSFVTDLSRRYAVVEVAVYPATGRPLEVSDLDFGLKFDGRDSLSRAASPRTIAGALQRRAATPSRSRDIGVMPSVGVGVYDDGYGNRGTATSVGVGVGVGGNSGGPPAPASTPADRNVMERELDEHALVAVTADKPVAGYLFFPLPARKSVVVKELAWDGQGDPIRVVFSNAKVTH